MFKRAKSLEKLIEEAREQGEEIRSLLQELTAEQSGLHDFILEQLEMYGTLIEANIKANADVFNRELDNTQRDLRVKLDGLYRQQLNDIKKFLQFPSRGGQ